MDFVGVLNTHSRNPYKRYKIIEGATDFEILPNILVNEK
jgi:hypothetical protein